MIAKIPDAKKRLYVNPGIMYVRIGPVEGRVEANHEMPQMFALGLIAVTDVYRRRRFICIGYRCAGRKVLPRFTSRIHNIAVSCSASSALAIRNG